MTRPALLSGVDDLLTYHYHVAELLRARPDLEPEPFLALDRGAQADFDLGEARARFGDVAVADRVDRVFELAGLRRGRDDQ